MQLSFSENSDVTLAPPLLVIVTAPISSGAFAEVLVIVTFFGALVLESATAPRLRVAGALRPEALALGSGCV